MPVYIRHGDEPLSEIHPGLAEAFKEGQSKGLEAEVSRGKPLNGNSAGGMSCFGKISLEMDSKYKINKKVLEKYYLINII